MHTSNKYSSNPMWIASGVTANRQLGLCGRGLSWLCKFSRPRFRLPQLSQLDRACYLSVSQLVSAPVGRASGSTPGCSLLARVCLDGLDT
jgi:hypothetical protein